MDKRIIKANFILDLNTIEDAFDQMEAHNIESQASEFTTVQARVVYEIDQKDKKDKKSIDDHEREYAELSKSAREAEEKAGRWKEWHGEILKRYCNTIRKLYHEKHWTARDIAKFLEEDEYKVELIIFDKYDI